MYLPHALVVALALLVSACDAIDGYLPEPQLPVGLRSEATLPEAEPALTGATVEDDRVVLHTDGTGSLDIESGDVLVGELDGGYLRRAVAVRVDGEDVIVDTEPAALDELIARGRIAFEMDSSGIEVAAHCGADCAPAIARQLAPVALVDVSGTVLFDSDVGGVPVTVTVVRGSLQMDPRVTVDASFAEDGIDALSVELSATVTADVELAVQSSGTFSLAEELDLSGPGLALLSYPFAVVLPTPIGPLPVVGVLELDAYAGFAANLDATGTLAVGGRGEVAIGGGLTLDGEGVSERIDPPAWQGTPAPVTLEGVANGEVRGYLRPEARLRLYGVAGGQLSVTPSIVWTGSWAPPAEPNASLQACIAAAAGVNASVFGVSLVDWADVIERCTELL